MDITPEFRKRMIIQLIEALRESPSFCNIAMVQLKEAVLSSEQYIYGHSRNREDYLLGISEKLYKIRQVTESSNTFTNNYSQNPSFMKDNFNKNFQHVTTGFYKKSDQQIKTNSSSNMQSNNINVNQQAFKEFNNKTKFYNTVNIYNESKELTSNNSISANKTVFNPILNNNHISNNNPMANPILNNSLLNSTVGIDDIKKRLEIIKKNKSKIQYINKSPILMPTNPQTNNLNNQNDFSKNNISFTNFDKNFTDNEKFSKNKNITDNEKFSDYKNITDNEKLIDNKNITDNEKLIDNKNISDTKNCDSDKKLIANTCIIDNKKNFVLDFSYSAEINGALKAFKNMKSLKKDFYMELNDY